MVWRASLAVAEPTWRAYVRRERGFSWIAKTLPRARQRKQRLYLQDEMATQKHKLRLHANGAVVRVVARIVVGHKVKAQETSI